MICHRTTGLQPFPFTASITLAKAKMAAAVAGSLPTIPCYSGPMPHINLANI
jgi:hypothetical protein